MNLTTQRLTHSIEVWASDRARTQKEKFAGDFVYHQAEMVARILKDRGIAAEHECDMSGDWLSINMGRHWFAAGTVNGYWGINHYSSEEAYCSGDIGICDENKRLGRQDDPLQVADSLVTMCHKAIDAAHGYGVEFHDDCPRCRSRNIYPLDEGHSECHDCGTEFDGVTL